METENRSSSKPSGERRNGPPPLPARTGPKHSGTGFGWIVVGTVCVVGVLGFFWMKNHLAAQKAAETARSGSPAVPVLAVKVGQKDVPIFLDGLGTVQAFNAVAIRVRVDGQLVKVAFTEGQDVKVGDLLVQIDPAPYKAALAQAVAK